MGRDITVGYGHKTHVCTLWERHSHLVLYKSKVRTRCCSTPQVQVGLFSHDSQRSPSAAKHISIFHGGKTLYDVVA